MREDDPAAESAAEGSDLSEEIVSWLELRCQGETERPALRLYNYLRGSQLVRDAAAPFRAALAARLECIVKLLPQVEKTGSARSDPRSAQWLRAARFIAGRWPPSSRDDWSAMIVELSEEEDRTLMACVSQSLRDSLRGLPASAALQACAGELAQWDSRYWSDFPLPPAEGRSLDAESYVALASGGLLARLEAACEALSDLADRLEASRGKGSSTDRSPRADALCAAAQNELGILLRSARSGLPVQRDPIVACTSLLVERLEELARRLSDDAAADRPTLRALTAEIESLRAALAGGPAAVRLDPSAADDMSRAAAAAQAAPAPASLASRLGALAAQMARQADPLAADLASRLREIAEQPHESASEVASLRRKALSCLMHVDDLVSQSRGASWTAEARAQLRDLLLQGGDYVLLDRQLLGRPIESCARLVEAVGFDDGGAAASHIARVERPGYALKLADGSQQVLRPARVLLGR